MELDLDIVDYLQVSLTAKKCLQILPNIDKKSSSQKVVVGDQSGILQCLSLKKREINTAFKTLPGPAINRVVLGGALGTVQDKIFVASNLDVRGYSRRGKKFLDFNTNLTESITNLCISGSELLAGGSYLYNHFSDCVDQGYYFSPDKINDLICIQQNTKPFTSVLACNDKVIRLLKGCELKHELQVAAVPSCVIQHSTTSSSDDVINLVYGMEDGSVSKVAIENGEPTFKWQIANTKSFGGVSCIGNYDVTGDGVDDLLIGREDGTVQIFSYDATDEPVLQFSHCFSESITSICGGRVGSSSAPEVLASTYSGWISGLTTEQVYRNIAVKSDDKKISQIKDEDLSKKLNAIKSEIEALQLKVEEEREKYVGKIAQPKVSENAVTKVNQLLINDRFVLNASDASYHLTIESPTSIEHIVLQSDVPIDILDSDDTSAVISYTSTQRGDNLVASPSDDQNFLLVTYRCQTNTTRLQVKIRSIEGHHGHIQAYVVPRLHPKTCVVRRYPIKPLSLHQRCHKVDEKRPMSVLRLTGSFSEAEAHSWLATCLPDVPEKAPTEEHGQLCFSSTFLGTQLKCIYRKGEVTFHSDNISTISILKDFMSKEATLRKITLNIRYEFSEESINHTLTLLHPKLEQQLMLAKKMQLLEALKEIETNEDGNVGFLAPEYQDILQNSEEIKKDFAKQPAHLERLYGMLTDLYIDKYKFKGVNVKHRVPQLLETLDDYNLIKLQNFFSH